MCNLLFRRQHHTQKTFEKEVFFFTRAEINSPLIVLPKLNIHVPFGISLCLRLYPVIFR